MHLCSLSLFTLYMWVHVYFVIYLKPWLILFEFHLDEMNLDELCDKKIYSQKI